MTVLFPRRGFQALLLLFVSVLLASCASTPDSPGQLVQSPNDDFQYRLLTLENQMEVLLISDPDTPKAAAALDVMVGSGDNPPGRAGLAHFLEHMLFLGTEKYPDAAEYEQYITEHGGNRNAYTSFEHTNYFFDINPPYLPEALDRFAQFFISPRFDAQYVDREKNAVEAEYQMGLKSDPRRGLDVLQETMNPDHPFSQFSVGSLETLADRPDSGIRDDLLRFYDKHYSANVMRLVVLGAQPLDELQVLVEPLFNQVPDKSFEHPVIEAPLFEEDALPMLVQVQPLATLRQLDVSFPIGDYREHYRAKPLSYLGNLVGHEGEGSLLSQLKAEGLAESLSAGAGLGWRGGALFSISVSLTEKGAAQHERVLQLVFAYLDMLRVEGPQDWLYEEQASLAALAFRYREQSNPMRYVSALASGMHEYDKVDTLRGPYLMEHFDQPMLVDLMAQLVPERAQVVLTDKDVTVGQASQYYDVPYSVASLELDGLVEAGDKVVTESLHLPAPNEFIAQDVSLVKLPGNVPGVPQLTLEKERQLIWFMQDDEFRLPKGVTYINFRSPEMTQSAAQSAMASLYTALLMDQVNEIAYPAHLAGMNFNFYNHARGISLRVGGYNDKQKLLLVGLLQGVVSPEFEQQRFEDIRQDQIRSLENAIAKRPSRQVMDDLNEAVTYGAWAEQALIRALSETSLLDLNEYISRFWHSASAEVLVYGNYDADAVQELSGMLDGILAEGTAPTLPDLRVLKIAAGESLLYAVDVPHDDAVLAWYLQGAGNSWEDRAAAALTGQIIKSGFFQQLRTEQQLGYVVSAFNWSKHDVPGLVLLIQSPVADADALSQAMQAFMAGVLPDLDGAQFERHKEALISDILRPDKNLHERAEYYWQAIARKEWDFAGRQTLAAAVEAFTLDDWAAYFKRVYVNERHSLQVVTAGRRGKLPGNEAQHFDVAAEIKNKHDSYNIE